MKVWERKIEPNYVYPDEMEKILSYLNQYGTILVNGQTIEKLYREFSNERYCASWMRVDDDILEQFTDWLEEKEF